MISFFAQILITSTLTFQNNVKVLINTGQSNSAGVSPNTSVPANELVLVPNLLIYSKNSGSFEPLKIGVNNLGASINTHGLEIGLVNYYLANPNETLYFIKWGLTTTYIVEHLIGGIVYEELWNNFVKPAINLLLSQGKIPNVFFSYLQGERDSNTNNTTNAYSSNFDTLVSLWQTNLGANLPFIPIEIIETNANDITINNVFANKALTMLNRIKVVDTAGFTNIGDNLHYNYASQKAIGLDVLTKMQQLTAVKITNPL